MARGFDVAVRGTVSILHLLLPLSPTGMWMLFNKANDVRPGDVLRAALQGTHGRGCF